MKHTTSLAHRGVVQYSAPGTCADIPRKQYFHFDKNFRHGYARNGVATYQHAFTRSRCNLREVLSVQCMSSVAVSAPAVCALPASALLAMPTSHVGVATRAFVAVLLLLARRYELVLLVNRDSSPEQLVKAYKNLFRKVHPDKGGRKVDAQWSCS